MPVAAVRLRSCTLHGLTSAAAPRSSRAICCIARSTFAFPFGLGVKFYTAFQDGGLLVSETFEGCPADQSAVVVNQKSGSIAQTWSDHQNQMHALEQEGKVVDRQSSFEFFTQILPRG